MCFLTTGRGWELSGTHFRSGDFSLLPSPHPIAAAPVRSSRLRWLLEHALGFLSSGETTHVCGTSLSSLLSWDACGSNTLARVCLRWLRSLVFYTLLMLDIHCA